MGAKAQQQGVWPQREGTSRNPKMHAHEESDTLVVPKKSANSRVTPEESMEGRGVTRGKPAPRNAPGTQRPIQRAHVTERVGQRAKEEKGVRFNNLFGHLRVPLLTEAYWSLRRRAAPGLDGETWARYGEQLEARLEQLEERLHRGNYHPQPVRRVFIPKPDGRVRPLGIPALEDKVVQQAVRMLLDPLYENSEFVGFSYGFRPGRSPHAALDALWVAVHKRVSWVLDADIQSFFDTIDHGWMQRFLEHRIADRRLVRLIMRWLRAGVMEDGVVHVTGEGTPQGGIISPLLANIYLHYVLDQWAHQWRRRHARGDVFIVRYADDFVMCFQWEQDARAMKAALAQRLAKFRLSLHPEKTRVIRFGRFARKNCVRDGRRRPETFDFLGFTHISGEDPNGDFRLIRRTSAKKRRAKLASLREEVRRRKHEPADQQHRWLSSVLRGHYGYYGVPGNTAALRVFRARVRAAWHRALQSRSQRARWTAARRDAFEACFPLPPPRLTHPHPYQRFVRP